MSAYMKVRILFLSFFIFFLSGSCAYAELNIDISGSYVEIKDATTLRIRNISVPGQEGKYWADLQWNPLTLVAEPVNFGAESLAGKSWTIAINTNSAGLLGSLNMTLTTHPENRTIDISLSAVEGSPTFTFASLLFIQNGQDFDFGYGGATSTALFTPNGGWNPYAATISVGVTRTGTVSNIPNWFDFNTPFTLSYWPSSFLLQ